MTNFKKISTMAAALVIAATMTAGTMVASASAAPAPAASGSITITETDPAISHGALKAYRVFNGVYNTDGSLQVTNWGNGVDADSLVQDFLTAFNITDATGYDASAAGAQKVADYLSTFANDSEDAKTFAKLAANNLGTSAGTLQLDEGKYTLEDIDEGYYLVVDSTGATITPADGEPLEGDTAYTLGLLKVVGEASGNTKIDYPTLIKKVQENVKYSGDTYGAGFNDVADWDIGSDIPFEIIATLPSNWKEYDQYYMEFSDTYAESFGEPENIQVTSSAGTLDTSSYKVVTSENSFKVIIGDLNDVTVDGQSVDIDTNSTITVSYTLQLTEDAVIGLDGQENKAKLTYSNNPNAEAKGDSDNDDSEDKPDDEDTGETPEDKVIVFTYEMDITKKESITNNAMEGVEFILGNGTKYAVVTNGVFTSWTDDIEDATKLTSNANGLFTVKGIDDGTYYLYEQPCAANADYNVPTDPFVVVLSADTNNGHDSYDDASDALVNLTGTINNASMSANVNAGKVEGIIENSKNTSLPETGGIGTKIFYGVGGALSGLAAVALIAKKRMSKKD